MSNTSVQPLPVSLPNGGGQRVSGMSFPQTASPRAVSGIGFNLTLAFIFMVFGRIPELVAIKTGVQLPIAMLISLGAGIAALFAADIRRLSRMRAVQWLLAFTVWLLIAGVFSTWHGGTYQMFKDYWSKSILICLVVSMVVITVEDLRKIMYALTYGTMIIILTGLLFSGTAAGRMTVLDGSLSNPNELAGRLLTGFCFCLFLIENERGFSFKRAAVILSLPLLLWMVLRTGSRSGLLTLAMLFVMLVVRATMTQRVLIIAGSVTVLMFFFAVLPKDATSRYALMFSSQKGTASEALTEEEKMAVGSRDARARLAQEAVDLTLTHPVFGVGPGVYESAAAEQAKTEGRRAMWHETHNTYLQISAEAGVPALILYLLALFSCLAQTFRIYRKTRRDPELATISKISYCLMLALMSWMAGALFDSQAYRLEFPMMAGLICAFSLAAAPVIQRRVASQSKPALATVSVPGMTPVAAAPAAQPSFKQNNPYRFGRLRSR